MHDRTFLDAAVVVTGGTSGIGEQLARDLLSQGARVTICSDDATAVAGAADRFRAGDRLTAEVCDLRSTDQVTRFARDAERRYGQVDVLVNNAGYAVYRAFDESSVDEVLDIVDVNLGGAMRCTKAFLPGMIARHRGLILNVSSVAGYLPITPNAAYCGAKHALVGWTRALSYEVARFGVWVGVLCPDHVQTGFQHHPTFQRRARYRARAERLTVEAVSATALDAIRRRRTVTFVPRRLAAVVWAMRVCPAVTEPFWRRMMSRRVDQLYDEIAREASLSSNHPTAAT
jgi:short-subunit dehydrogenase